MMKKRRLTAMLAGIAGMCLMLGSSALAAVDADLARKYDNAVNTQAALDCIDATVKETTSLPGQKESTTKTIHLKASGLQSGDMVVSIKTSTDEGDTEQYYKNGYFYTDQSGEKIKLKMSSEKMFEMMHSDIYLNFDSGRLATLDVDDDDDMEVFGYTATADSMGDYIDKLLEGAQDEHNINIITIQGTMTADANNAITRRQIQTVYTAKSDDGNQACILESKIKYNNPGEEVVVELPDLSVYEKQEKEKAAVEVTRLEQTVYATDDVNIRAQNGINAAVIGGAVMGTALQELGYTSDGWVQISFGEGIGYVSADFVSTTKPIIIVDMSGTMYATATVYVRSMAGTAGDILGTLTVDDGIAVTGYTDNNWIRVKYKGQTAYVCADYLSWDQPTVSGSLSGVITDRTWNTMTVRCDNGQVLSMGTTGTYFNSVDGVLVGDYVSVSYERKGDQMTAVQINDYTYHNLDSTGSNSAGQGSNDVAYGIVMSCGMSSLTLAGNDGRTISFDKAGTPSSMQLCVGAYVGVYYKYNASTGSYKATYIDVID